MATLISLILVIIGCVNWFCIGALQFDFIAGMFGSQANVFSRLVYALIGVASLWLIFVLIKNKGKLTFNFKRFKKNKDSVGQALAKDVLHQVSPQHASGPQHNLYHNNRSEYGKDSHPYENNNPHSTDTQQSNHNSNCSDSNNMHHNSSYQPNNTNHQPSSHEHNRHNHSPYPNNYNRDNHIPPPKSEYD